MTYQIILAPEAVEDLDKLRANVRAGVRDAIELLLEEDRLARTRAAEALFQVEAPVADWSRMEGGGEGRWLNHQPIKPPAGHKGITGRFSEGHRAGRPGG